MSQPLFEFFSWHPAVIFDLWSFIHFAWGAMLAALFRLVKLPPKLAYALALIFMLGWELAEILWHTPQPFFNGISDIIVASAGFWLFYKLLPERSFWKDAAFTIAMISAGFLAVVFAGA